MPDLGTGVGKVGKVGSRWCAKQVRAAIDNVFLKQIQMPKHWTEASESHQLLYGDEVRDLQYSKSVE